MDRKRDDLDELPEWVKLIKKYSKKEKRNCNNKGPLHKTRNLSLEELVLFRLENIPQPMFSDQIIRFPQVFSKICPILCLTKDQAWFVLKKLDKAGKIEIVPYQGIRIKKRNYLKKYKNS